MTTARASYTASDSPEKPRPVGMVVNRPSGGVPMQVGART